MSTPIAYAFKRRSGRYRVLCLQCSRVEPQELNVHSTDEHRARFGDGRTITCQDCGKRLDGDIALQILPDELAVLRFALDHALSSTSEAHPQDRAQLQALIERLEATRKGGRS